MTTPIRKTLLDVAVGLNPDGRPARVFEVLNQKWPILTDAPAFPSNAPMGNRVTIRTALPTVSRLRINQGIVPSKSAKTQRIDTIGMLGGRSEVDKKMLRIYGSDIVNNERWTEDRAFIEAMGQQCVTDLLYGDENVDSASMTGLAPRMAALNSLIKNSQVFSMGSVTGGDGTSIYVVDWGEDGAHLIYPKDGEMSGSGGGELAAAGLRVDPKKDPIQVLDAAGNFFDALVTEFDWFVGFTVKDPRHIARLPNIDTSDANLTSPTQGTLHDRLVDMLTNMPSADGFQRVLYCTRSILAAFYKQLQNKANVWLSMQEYLGKPMLHFQGFPLRAVDAISAAESTVS